MVVAELHRRNQHGAAGVGVTTSLFSTFLVVTPTSSQNPVAEPLPRNGEGYPQGQLVATPTQQE
jgi:hypothetical protein